MPFDQDVLLWCAAIPALIAVVAAGLAWLTESKITKGSRGQTVAALIACLGWSAAVLVGLAARHEWQWLPHEFWQQSFWAVLAAAVFLGGTTAADAAEHPWRLAAAGVLAVATAWLAMPMGEGWEDMLPLHRNWMAAVTASCLLNSWAIDRLARTEARRWVLWIVLAGLAGPFALAAATYGALSEWTLSALAATVSFAVIAVAPSATSLWSVAFPALFFSAAMTAATRFYSYEDHPWWLYGIALFSPLLIAVADIPLRNRATRWRVLTAAVFAAVLVGVCVWRGVLVGQDLS
ncbi:MAG: hypothetical protein WD070_01290 [Pirellulaceae bacterium]